MDLTSPRKKKKCQAQYSGPLPIPIQGITQLKPSKHLWNYFEGKLNRTKRNVTVNLSGDMKTLSTMGFFGEIVTTENEDVLALTLEESFFLSYILGCLFINEEENSHIDISKQWEIYCTLKPNFPVTYAAYNHFRAKGWVPKDGIKYGAHFILYQKGPPFYHSTYVVKIETLSPELKVVENHDLATSNTESWTSIAGLNRLCSSVAKILLCCGVIIPDNVEEIITNPNCLKIFKIHERIIKRWIPSKDREKELDAESL